MQSLAGEPCKVKTGWTGRVRVKTIGIDGDSEHDVNEQAAGDELVLVLRKGEEVILYQGDEMPDLRISPVQPESRPIRYYGGHKPWRLHRM
ncbi:hypothetical protein D3C73_1426610 [compost metagenome]